MDDVVIVTAGAALTGPLFAVLITLWYQQRKERRDEKRAVFFALYAHRRSEPIAQDWVRALNLIDVVFQNKPEVVRLWNEYYAMLANFEATRDEDRNRKYLDLLSAVAQASGFRSLPQTSIDRYYSPRQYENRMISDAELNQELMRVLRNSASLNTELRDPSELDGKDQ